MNPLQGKHANKGGAAGTITGRFVVDGQDHALALMGELNANLRQLEKDTGVRAHCRGTEITLVGESHQVAMATKVLEGLMPIVRNGKILRPDDVSRAASVLRMDGGADIPEILAETILVANRARPIAPKGLAQKQYVDAIRSNDIVFGVGPAGTGKTYLAMALAVRALMEKRVKRIVLTRPAVEAGERLGFLPGTLEEKVLPYLRPLYDALNDMMDSEKVEQLVQRGHIEIAPLAFMRGRTLNDSFVILDEAQNTTGEQMQMFLTRLGFDSQVVVTGDLTQVDLGDARRSGLAEAVHILGGIEGIALCRFSEVDVVRHRLVREVIKAYDRHRNPPE